MICRHPIRLLVLALVLSVSAAAQEQQPQSPQAAPANQDTLDRANQQQEPSEKLDQAAAEAAAEDPHAEFKESASVKWLAKRLGISLPAAYWVSVVLNFTVVMAAIWFAMRKFNVAGSMRERTAAIRRQMEEAQRASEEAARRISDIESRLASLDAEIAGLRSQAEQEANREEERLLAAAEEEKRKIVSGAEQDIAAAAKAARADLRAYAAELAVGLAAKKIRVDEASDKALVGEFVSRLGKDAR